MRYLLLLCGILASSNCLAIEAGKPAPAFTAKLSDGTQFSLEQHRGEVVILDFWACWCAPCVEELAALRKAHEKYAAQGLTILAINTDDPEDMSKVARIVPGLPYALARASDVKADGYGRIWRLPMTFVIDRQGLLRVDGGAGSRHTYDLPTLEKIIEPLLAEKR